MSTGRRRAEGVHESSAAALNEALAASVDERLRNDRALERGRMVVEAVARRGIRSAPVLNALAAVPRHRFVAPVLAAAAYEGRPLAIGHGQFTSDPYTLARVLELARPGTRDVALEVGAGCGYQTALLAELCAEVFAVEWLPALAERARATLQRLGHHNVHVGCFDGSGGWPAHGPYNVIVVAAACEKVPSPLLHQLAIGGRLVLPLVGPGGKPRLTCVERSSDGFTAHKDAPCASMTLGGRFGMGTPVAQA